MKDKVLVKLLCVVTCLAVCFNIIISEKLGRESKQVCEPVDTVVHTSTFNIDGVADALVRVAEVAANSRDNVIRSFIYDTCNVDSLLSEHGAFELQFEWGSDAKTIVNRWDYITVYKDGVVRRTNDGAIDVATVGLCFSSTEDGNKHVLLNLGSDLFDDRYVGYWEQLYLMSHDDYIIDSYLKDGNTTLIWARDIYSQLSRVYTVENDILKRVTIKNSFTNEIICEIDVVPITDYNADSISQCLDREDVSRLYNSIFIGTSGTPILVDEISSNKTFTYKFYLADGINVHFYTKNNDCILYNSNGHKNDVWTVPTGKLHYEVKQ